MSDSLTLTAGDTAPSLGVKVNANLTGATVVAHIVRPDKTVLVRTVTVTSATLGEGSVIWQTGDLAQAGQHKVEVQVTFSDLKVQTFALGDTDLPGSFSVRRQYA